MRYKTTLTGFLIIYAASIAAAWLLLGNGLLHVLKVWLALLLIGTAFFPLTARLFRSFSDRGWIQSKLTGLVIAGYAAFVLILTHTVRFRRGPLAVCTLLAAAAVWAGAFFTEERITAGETPGQSARAGGFFSRVPRSVKGADLTLVLTEELLFFMILVLWCRLYGFDFQGMLHSEGPFDYGILSSLMRSDTLPPADMWDCTRVLGSYYYGGHYFAAFLTKLTGARSNEMFTICKALIPAVSSGILFSTVWHFMRDRKSRTDDSASYAAGFLSVLFLMCSGNPHYLLYGLLRLPYTGAYSFWSTTRYIRDTITEIPAFSFILGDFHAHVTDMMFVCCFLSLLYAWMQQVSHDPAEKEDLPAGLCAGCRAAAGSVLRDPYFYFLGLFISVFFMNNTWDAPIYVWMFMIALTLMTLRSRKGSRLFTWVFSCVFMAALLFVFSAPFRSSFSASAVRGLAAAAEHTSLSEFLSFWGLHLSALAALLVFTVCAHRFTGKQKGFTVWLRGLPLPDLFALTAGACAVCTILAPEFVGVMDIFGGRMNTVFKTWFQGRILLDFVCGYACLRLLLDTRKLLPRAAGAVLCVLFLFSCGYFPMGIAEQYGNVTDRRGYFGLDAESAVERMLPEDAGAIRWLEENVSGQPHILEAYLGTWGLCGRVASVTGLPTVLGWYNHELQYFMDRKDVDRRKEDVMTVYTGRNEELIRRILRQYEIRYVFVGHEEMKSYDIDHALLGKFGTVVYRDESSGTYILEVQ